MSKRKIWLVGAGLLLLAILFYQIPAVNSRISWRYEVGKTFLRNVINPVGNVPTAIPNPTSTISPATPTVLVSPTSPVVETPIPPTPTLEPPPAQALLGSPPYEKQTPNNCGPAALSMMLHMYGWRGDQ